MAQLIDYETNETIREATPAEARESAEAAMRDGGAGVIRVDSVRCYVPEEAEQESELVSAWDYEGYWGAVLGGGSAQQVVDEYGLDTSDIRGLDEWLGLAESASWSAGGPDGDPMPEEWAGFHTVALAELAKVATTLLEKP